MAADYRRRTARASLDAERVLPHSLDAERVVLGAILVNNAAYERAARVVSASEMFRDAHRRIFAMMARLMDRPGGCVDLVLLKDALATHGDLEEVGGAAYLSALVDGVPRSTNIEHYARVVKEKALYRGLIAAANRIVVRAYEAEEAASEILTDADRALVALRQGGSDDRLRSLRQTTGEIFERLEWRTAHKGEVTGVPTGFRSIDELTNGWQPGDLVIVAARPSIGKTTFVMNSATHAAITPDAAGALRQVVVFSLEMRRSQLEDRQLAALSGIPLTRIMGGYILESEWSRLTEAIGLLGQSGMSVDDVATRTVTDIRRGCRRIIAEHGRLDLVVVDYIQLMSSDLARKGATRTEELADMSRRLKLLADELAVPMIVLSQLSRGSEDRADPRPKLRDLRESGALEQNADTVAFLHRRNHRVSGTTEFIAEKQRNGPTGTVNLTIDRDLSKFTDGGVPLPEPSPEERADQAKGQKARWFKRKAHAT